MTFRHYVINLPLDMPRPPTYHSTIVNQRASNHRTPGSYKHGKLSIHTTHL